MRHLLHIGVITAATVMLVGCTTLEKRARPDMGPDQHIAYTPDEVTWEPGPASLPPGMEWTVLEGDHTKAEMFTMRLRAPDGYEIPPHWHPNFERLNVLQGTLHLGMGEVFDEDAAQALEAGSYTVMPPSMRHYAYAEGQTVLQITTYGPWDITYVDPADDPRR